MLELTTLSERRVCRLAGLSRDAFRDSPEPAAAMQALSARIIELVQVRRGFGYRRLHDLLRPEFPEVNHKKIYRLYREASLAVRSEEHTSELQSLMRISYAVFCLQKKKIQHNESARCTTAYHTMQHKEIHA